MHDAYEHWSGEFSSIFHHTKFNDHYPFVSELSCECHKLQTREEIKKSSKLTTKFGHYIS